MFLASELIIIFLNGAASINLISITGSTPVRIRVSGFVSNSSFFDNLFDTRILFFPSIISNALSFKANSLVRYPLVEQCLIASELTGIESVKRCIIFPVFIPIDADPTVLYTINPESFVSSSFITVPVVKNREMAVTGIITGTESL